MRTVMLSAALLLLGTLGLRAQSPSAILKLETLYTAEQIQDMKDRDPAKWKSMVWFYASSWEVQEGASFRPATEAEILAVNIKPYDNERKADEAVTVMDTESGLTLKLLSADQCFEALKTVLTAAEWDKLHQQYLRNKAQRDATSLPKASN